MSQAKATKNKFRSNNRNALFIYRGGYKKINPYLSELWRTTRMGTINPKIILFNMLYQDYFFDKCKDYSEVRQNPDKFRNQKSRFLDLSGNAASRTTSTFSWCCIIYCNFEPFYSSFTKTVLYCIFSPKKYSLFSNVTWTTAEKLHNSAKYLRSMGISKQSSYYIRVLKNLRHDFL